MSLNKKQKLILNLILLQEVDEEQIIVNKVMFNNSNKAHEMFLTRKTEGVFSILIEKNLWREGCPLTTSSSTNFTSSSRENATCVDRDIFKKL
jgi:hypothetical protein